MKVMNFEFTDTYLFGIDNECIEVAEILYGPSPEQIYIQCIEIAEEYGIVLESIKTKFLGEECEFSLCPDTGDFLIKVLT